MKVLKKTTFDTDSLQDSAMIGAVGGTGGKLVVGGVKKAAQKVRTAIRKRQNPNEPAPTRDAPETGPAANAFNEKAELGAAAGKAIKEGLKEEPAQSSEGCSGKYSCPK